MGKIGHRARNLLVSSMASRFLMVTVKQAKRILGKDARSLDEGEIEAILACFTEIAEVLVTAKPQRLVPSSGKGS